MVSLQEYMAFMISRETENVQSSQDVEAAFRALTSGEKPFISGQELYAVSTADYEIIVTVSSLNRKCFVGLTKQNVSNGNRL